MPTTARRLPRGLFAPTVLGLPAVTGGRFLGALQVLVGRAPSRFALLGSHPRRTTQGFGRCCTLWQAGSSVAICVSIAKVV